MKLLFLKSEEKAVKHDKVKRSLALAIFFTLLLFVTLRINEAHSEHDRETVKYIELIKASYWASWRFGREVHELEMEVSDTIYNDVDSPQKIKNRIDFLIVNYEFLTTDANVFKRFQGYAKDSIANHIEQLDHHYNTLLSQENWRQHLPEILDTVSNIKVIYDDVVLYELKGYDLSEFVNAIKDDRKSLLYAIYMAIIGAAITIPAITYLTRSLKVKSLNLETDYLTGLKNRKYCLTALKRQIEKGEPLGFCFLDLNGFKEVNDTLGHDAGDQLLKIIARRVQKSIKSSDTFARLGGDEFGLIIVNFEHRADIEVALTRIMGMISQPIELEGNIIQVGCSAGISIYQQKHFSSEKELMAAADSAMYKAKSEKHNQLNNYAFYQS
ncbi:GGDEF domain-containing protein [Vibrio atlanticus]|nr:GGDEF domain-containing protein [Vibrio atlanticus]